MDCAYPGYNQPMPELDITASDAHVYDVTITDQTGAKTEHCVTVPERLLRDLGIAASQEPALDRASMIYLLERESASSVLAAFTLDEITGYFPGSPREITGLL
jgi:hypothetical protein